MYLQLLDGTIINDLQRINPGTFKLNSDDSSLYYKLNGNNLSLALLFEGDLLEDVFIDYKLTNFSNMSGVIRFRIDRAKGGIWDEFKSVATINL